MSHHNTVFSQLLKLPPRHEFETLAKQHYSGRSFRTASRWAQFVTMRYLRSPRTDFGKGIAYTEVDGRSVVDLIPDGKVSGTGQ
jgi:hypothetical protein